MADREELRISINMPPGPERDAAAAAVIREFEASANRMRQDPPELPADTHVVIEHQEMWRCMATRPDGPMDSMRDDLRCVLVEHEGDMHMRWDGSIPEYWTQ